MFRTFRQKSRATLLKKSCNALIVSLLVFETSFLEAADKAKKKEQIEGHQDVFGMAFDFFVRVSKSGSLVNRFQKTSGDTAAAVGRRSELQAFLVDDEVLKQGANDRESVSANFRQGGTNAVGKEALKMSDAMSYLSETLNFEFDIAQWFSSPSGSNVAKVRKNLVLPAGSRRSAPAAASNSNTNLVANESQDTEGFAAAKESPDTSAHAQQSEEGDLSKAGKFRLKFDSKVTDQNSDADLNSDITKGTVLRFENGSKNYTYLQPVGPGGGDPKHELRVPIKGKLNAGLELNKALDPTRTSLFNVWKRGERARMNLHYDILAKQYISEYILNTGQSEDISVTATKPSVRETEENPTKVMLSYKVKI